MERYYLDLLQQVLDKGKPKADRTGVGTLSLFGAQLRFDLRTGFPLVTTKKLHLRSIVYELLWFLRGDTHLRYLHEHGVTIWDNWRAPYGRKAELVPVVRRVKPYVPLQTTTGRSGLNIPQGSIDDLLAGSWAKMLNRCYDESAHNYKYYGGAGVSVCERWHNFSNFLEDVKQLPHWWYKFKNWNRFELDKDYYGSRQYGPDTCIWLPKNENVHSHSVCIESPEGELLIFPDYQAASSAVGIRRTTLHRFVTEGLPTILKGNNRQFAGWKFYKYEEENTDVLLRKPLMKDEDLGPIYGKQWRAWDSADGETVDQIANVIHTLRTDPHSRRIVVSAWNTADIPRMALAPCHILFQFYVADGELSCQVYQRSADLFLGVPFNIASYALLTHLVAEQTDLKVGDLIWTGGDCHLYSNHLDQARLQLEREPYPSPRLMVYRRPDKIEDYRYEDFKIVGYQAHPAIKAPIAV